MKVLVYTGTGLQRVKTLPQKAAISKTTSRKRAHPVPVAPARQKSADENQNTTKRLSAAARCQRCSKHIHSRAHCGRRLTEASSARKVSNRRQHSDRNAGPAGWHRNSDPLGTANSVCRAPSQYRTEYSANPNNYPVVILQ